MNTVEMWQVLEMEPTKDEDLIVNAYRSKVVTVNPEDDQEGFMRGAWNLFGKDARDFA